MSKSVARVASSKPVAPVVAVAVRPPSWGKMISQAMQRPDVQAKLHKPRPPKVHPIAWEGLIQERGFLTWLEGFVATRIRELTHGGRPRDSDEDQDMGRRRRGGRDRDREEDMQQLFDPRENPPPSPTSLAAAPSRYDSADVEEEDEDTDDVQYAEPVVVRRRPDPPVIPRAATDAADAIADDARDARPMWARKKTGDPVMDRMIANAVVETEEEYRRDPPVHHEQLKKRVRKEAHATGNRKIGALFP